MLDEPPRFAWKTGEIGRKKRPGHGLEIGAPQGSRRRGLLRLLRAAAVFKVALELVKDLGFVVVDRHRRARL